MAAAVAGTLLLAPAAAQSPSMAMLGTLQTGQWDIRYREGSAATRLCVRTGREFIQLKHGGAGACSRFVVEDAPGMVTVQYTCRGNGYGRTSIRRETPALVQIESQGIADGQPFALTAEARRTGACR
ncbi:hypothetical protein GRI40_10285 [Altererythrobacter aerius]|uniref:DUF3617 family protein n=2 Tax=Tsuneonella aeria TaxID=1837929 RepID=A0A6I4TG04_9SPHN|nr:hypothetical protein [Tsuneonella aeria]